MDKKYVAEAVLGITILLIGVTILPSVVQRKSTGALLKEATSPDVSSAMVSNVWPNVTDSQKAQNNTQCTIKAFSASPARVSFAGYTTLSWDATGCDSVIIGDLTYATVGTLTVGPLSTTKKYTLIANTGTGARAQTITVLVH